MVNPGKGLKWARVRPRDSVTRTVNTIRWQSEWWNTRLRHRQGFLAYYISNSSYDIDIPIGIIKEKHRPWYCPGIFWYIKSKAPRSFCPTPAPHTTSNDTNNSNFLPRAIISFQAPGSVFKVGPVHGPWTRYSRELYHVSARTTSDLAELSAISAVDRLSSVDFDSIVYQNDFKCQNHRWNSTCQVRI